MNDGFNSYLVSWCCCHPLVSVCHVSLSPTEEVSLQWCAIQGCSTRIACPKTGCPAGPCVCMEDTILFYRMVSMQCNIAHTVRAGSCLLGKCRYPCLTENVTELHCESCSCQFGDQGLEPAPRTQWEFCFDFTESRIEALVLLLSSGEDQHNSCLLVASEAHTIQS